MFTDDYLEVLFMHIEKAYDAMHRLEGGQTDYFVDFMKSEEERTNRFNKVLANDVMGYDCIRLIAVLTHPCEKCAADPEAWHTRAGFCEHKNN